MLPIQTFAPRVIAEIVRRQPASKERTNFAWQLAVGPALARVTTVDLIEGVLTVRSRDPRWSPELERAKATVLARLQHLLGPEAVIRIETR
jgi:hypothetical protein